MEINFAETKAIADTLPIGLYAKRRVPVAVVEGEQTSYYNPVTDEIVISYEIIAQGLKRVSEETYRETAIRSMLYHEVSHAILTPDNLPMSDWLNVFEDERIETILATYYHDTNFKRQCLTINGYDTLADVQPADSGFSKFYNIVRFGVGEKAFVDEVDELIKRYAKMTKVNYHDSWNYYYDVKDFYNKVVKSFSSSSDSDGKDGEGKGGSGVPTPTAQIDTMKNNNDNNSSSVKGMSKADNGENRETTDGENTIEGESIGRESPLTESEISALFEEVISKSPYIDNALTQKMAMIINNFSKKNNSGSAMNAYSGVFNPRAVANREDYKFWEKPTSVNGANKFGTFHLNLFIDESGSFCASEVPMNQLLRSLTEIESKNKNFTFDVVFCGMSERIVSDKRKRVFKAHGGNKLDKKVYEIYRKLQKSNTFNYNIACFDGDACSDGGRNDHGFGAFDHANSTIISDSYNKRYIEKDVHSAKVIYTDNYAEELIDNVVAVLSKAFR